jgi:hypothetical protein
MPPVRKVNKDFLKQVFAGKKQLIPRNQLRPIEVPHYDELSVDGLIKDVMSIPDLGKFFPEQKTPANRPDREFFFNIINTADPDYLSALIRHAQGLRFGSGAPSKDDNIIEVNEHWRKELEASPYYSSKIMTS